MISQKDLALAFGCSKQRISQLVALGMPLSSLADAKAWRDAYAQRKPGSRSKGTAAAVTASRASAPKPDEGCIPDRILVDLPTADYRPGVESLLTRAIRSEAIASYFLERARANAHPDLIIALQRAHNAALTARLSAEELVEKRQLAASKLITEEQVRALITSVTDPIIAALNGLSAEVAPQCISRETAAAALTASTQNILATVVRALQTFESRLNQSA